MKRYSRRGNLRIGGGAAFSGDRIDPAIEIVEKANVDYLACDYLAELTLSIQQKVKLKDPTKGYASDLVWACEELLPLCLARGVKFITNGGGANPQAAGEKVHALLKGHGKRGAKIAVITGDDICQDLNRLLAQGIQLKNLDTGEDFSISIKDRVINANVYLGAQPIVEALHQGAGIVITGRCADSALWLAPMIYEFDWRENGWDRLAAGSIVGHLLECSCQVTGGNFSNWKSVPEPWRIGYPIAEVYENGEAIITKPPDTGGLVSVETCKEQLLYEIHDPANYILPDVICDITQAKLEQVGPNRVKLSGVRGKPRPETLKALIGYRNGFMAEGNISYGWPDALEKAKLAERIVQEWVKQKKLQPEGMRTEFIGYNSIYGPLASGPEPEEIRARFAAHFKTREEAERFGREIVGLWVAPPAGATGVLGPPTVREVIALWPTLVPREAVHPKVTMLEV